MAFVELDEDIFDTPCQTLAVTTNCYGVMGAGIAKAFRDKVPGLYQHYRELHAQKKLGINALFIYPWSGTDKQVLIFPTKYNPRENSSLTEVTHNLKLLGQTYESLGITSLAIPPVGCGLGNLDYLVDIRPVMEKVFGPLPIEVRCVFGGTRKKHLGE